MSRGAFRRAAARSTGRADHLHLGWARAQRLRRRHARLGAARQRRRRGRPPEVPSATRPVGRRVEEPNAIVAVTRNGRSAINVCATMEPAWRAARSSVNATPTAANDRMAFLDCLAASCPRASSTRPSCGRSGGCSNRTSGRWRASAADPAWTSTPGAAQINRACEVLVVGADPPTSRQRCTAAEAGLKGVLAVDGVRPGGSLRHPRRRDRRKRGGRPGRRRR